VSDVARAVIHGTREVGGDLGGAAKGAVIRHTTRREGEIEMKRKASWMNFALATGHARRNSFPGERRR
jgi:hypothetical protein